MVSVAVTYVASYLLVRDLGDGSLGGSSRRSSAAARWPGHHPRVRQDLHVDRLGARARGRRLGSRGRGVTRHLSGFVAGNFRRLLARASVIVILMGIAYGVSTLGLGADDRSAVFASAGRVRLPRLWGPVTIAGRRLRR